VARTHSVSHQIIYRWREKYAGMTQSELAEMKALQEENRRLRHVGAQLSLHLAATREIAK
jgi:putative transposase